MHLCTVTSALLLYILSSLLHDVICKFSVKSLNFVRVSFFDMLRSTTLLAGKKIRPTFTPCGHH